MKTYLVLFILVLSGTWSTLLAQSIHVEHIGNIYNQDVSLYDLLHYDIQLLDSEEELVSINLTVEESSKGSIINLKSNLITLHRGSNLLTNHFKNNTNHFLFFDSKTKAESNRLNAIGFSYGEYSFCLEVKNQEEFLIAEKCQSFSIENNNELLLITPFDEEVLISDKPVFTWTRILNNSASLISYRIKIVESTEQMDARLAFSSNAIFYTNHKIRNNLLVYNNTFPEMDRHKFYYWQIEAFSNNQLIAISDIWEYQFNKKNVPDKIEGNYVLIKNTNQTHYFKGDKLNFQLINDYNQKDLDYKIVDSNGRELVLKNKQLQRVKHRNNYYKLDLKHKIQKHKLYTLVIQGHKQEYSLKFKSI